MELIRDARKFVNKIFKVGNEDIENIGQWFRSDINSLSNTLGASSHTGQQFGSRQGGAGGPFSLPAIFVTVLAASLAVNTEFTKHLRGK